MVADSLMFLLIALGFVLCSVLIRASFLEVRRRARNSSGAEVNN